MSSADVAVRIYPKLHQLDIQVLRALEALMLKYEYVPEQQVSRQAGLDLQETQHRLQLLNKSRLVRKWRGPYVGYTLNTAGYDVLAINSLVKADVLEAFGKPLGVGKESDVYDALTPHGQRVAVKFHRLGRTSFRQTRRKRDYAAEKPTANWLYQSKLAATKEYRALRLLYPREVAVPKPIRKNRHVVVMGMIEGVELYRHVEIPNSNGVLNEILLNVRKAYLESGIIHADLSEYNVLLKPDTHILIIDWPQYVTRTHPNAEQLLQRDLRNILKFFRRKHGVKIELDQAMAYVKGQT